MFDNAHQAWTGNWDGWLKLVDAAQKAGADFFGMDYVSGTSNDVRNMTYGKASFLRKWNGKDGAYFWDYYSSSTANNPWDPNWTMDIGTPDCCDVRGRQRCLPSRLYGRNGDRQPEADHQNFQPRRHLRDRLGQVSHIRHSRTNQRRDPPLDGTATLSPPATARCR